MKNKTPLLLLACSSICLFVQAQPLEVLSFTVNDQVPAAINSWRSSNAGTELTVIKQPGTMPAAIKLVVQVRSGQTIICGNQPSTAMLEKFAGKKTYGTADIVQILKSAEALKNGSYTLCARLYNAKNVAVSNEVCRSFTVAERDSKIDLPPAEISSKGLRNITALSSGNLPDETKAIIIDPNNPPNCDACNPNLVKITPSPSYSISFFANNSFTLAQSISITTTPAKLIKSIKAELSYYEFIPQNDDCLVCNKNSNSFGNFNSGVAASINGTGAGTHSLLFTFTPPKPQGNFPLSVNISMPPTVTCCEGLVRFCIRYTIAFDDCTVCNRTVCYEKKKPGNVLIDNPNPNNPQN